MGGNRPIIKGGNYAVHAEGAHYFKPAQGARYIDPVIEYPHDPNCFTIPFSQSRHRRQRHGRLCLSRQKNIRRFTACTCTRIRPGHHLGLPVSGRQVTEIRYAAPSSGKYLQLAQDAEGEL